MKLFCRKSGKGPSLVILHGLYGSSDNWMTFARNIGTYFTVYLPDLRNHGNSPHSPVHNYDAMSDDIAELISDSVSGKVILAGHSMGGKVAATFAVKYPELLNALVIIDITPFNGRSEQTAAYEQHSRILRALINTNVSGAINRNEIDLGLSKEIESEKVRSLMMKNLRRDVSGKGFSWKINTGVLLDNLDLIAGDIPVSDPGMTVAGFPVLVVRAENSEYVNNENFNMTLKLFPGAELREVKNAGHWVHADNPGELERILTDLLNN